MLNEALREAIRDLPEIGPDEQFGVLQCSSASATGAILWFAWVGSERFPRVVVKTPRNPASGDSIRIEWETINGIRGNAAVDALLPSPSRTFRIDDDSYYAYAGIPGRTMFSRFRNLILRSRRSVVRGFGSQALHAATALHGSDSRLVSGTDLAADFRSDLEALCRLAPHLPQPVIDAAEASIDELRGTRAQFPLGRVHGDFSPYNFVTTGLTSGDRVALIDWEHSELDRPQYLDICRFMSACTLMGRTAADNPRALLEMSSRENPLIDILLAPWLASMRRAAAAEPAVHTTWRAIWHHFWIHAARREQERRTDPADYSDGVYVNGLAGLLSS